MPNSLNPQFILFCQSTGIWSHVQELLASKTPESKAKIIELINTTPLSIELESQLLGDIECPVIIGNGDVMNYDQGLERVADSGVDGVMIGRGIFKDPWAFLSRAEAEVQDTKENRLRLLLEHLEAWVVNWSGQNAEQSVSSKPYNSSPNKVVEKSISKEIIDTNAQNLESNSNVIYTSLITNSPESSINASHTKNFAAMKKFVKMYVNGFDGASQLRGEFMLLNTPAEMIAKCRENL